MIYREITINGQQIKLIPLGDCACGCGSNPGVPSKTDRWRNHLKGRPLHYVHGHNPQKHGPLAPGWKGGRFGNGSGYVFVYCPGHYHATQSGHVLEHILVAEKALGKSLPQGAMPHHVNGKKGDNRPCNLVICQDAKYHKLLHQRTTAFKECGHANWRKCHVCKKHDDPKKLHITSTHCYHRSCRNAKRRESRLANKR